MNENNRNWLWPRTETLTYGMEEVETAAGHGTASFVPH